MTTVVNLTMRGPFDVNIGRPGPFGNPYRLGMDGDRATVCRKHRAWFYAPPQKALRTRVRHELKGKVLGCYCAPLECHGDTYAEYCDFERGGALDEQMIPQMMDDPRIFVFGSNRRGIHGAGAALFARRHYGALQMVGEGPMGNAYAVPTKDEAIKTLSIDQIRVHVQSFLEYASSRPDLRFHVTRIGCGLAGYTDAAIAILFSAAPMNCDLPVFPVDWRAL